MDYSGTSAVAIPMTISDHTWIVTRIDGKISSVALDYTGLYRLSTILTGQKPGLSKKKKAGAASKACSLAQTVATEKMNTEELLRLSEKLTWEDLKLFGTEFQLNVWKNLFDLNHSGAEAKLLSYSDFATICGNRPGIRAVAHAVGLNPLPVIIPCHRIIPKESIDRISEIEAAASKTIFSGADIWLFDAIDFGEYALGTKVKRDILGQEFSYGIPENK